MTEKFCYIVGGMYSSSLEPEGSFYKFFIFYFFIFYNFLYLGKKMKSKKRIHKQNRYYILYIIDMID